MSTDLHQYGPDKPCQCGDARPHLGGAHLDPVSDFYHGPDSSLAALPISCRMSAQVLMIAARHKGWDRRIVETALHELAEEIHRLRQQIAHVRVDRDRGIRDAMARAEDCAEHGAELRRLGHLTHSLSVGADANNEQRLAWLSACHEIDALTRPRVELQTWGEKVAPALIDGPAAELIQRIVARAGKQQDRIGKRRAAPTFADCERAGVCEHPQPPTPTLFEPQHQTGFADGATAAATGPHVVPGPLQDPALAGAS